MTDPDRIGITESLANANISDAKLLINRYILFQEDRMVGFIYHKLNLAKAKKYQIQKYTRMFSNKGT